MDIVLKQKSLLEDFFQELIDRLILSADMEGDVHYVLSKPDVAEVLDLLNDLQEELNGLT